MVVWKAHYTDEYHDLDTDITNTEGDYSSDPISFTIDGITFCGTSLFDFQIFDPNLYETARKKFKILKWGGRYPELNRQTPYCYDLQCYSLDIMIPIPLFKKSDSAIVQGNLRVYYSYVEHDMNKTQSIILCDGERVFRHDLKDAVFTLYVEGKEYILNCKSTYFEDALLDLTKLIREDYSLKCCFTCRYSDYSPYGSDDYGTLMCYRKHKEEYLKVNDKDSWFKYAESLPYEMIQETYCCGEYEPRTKCSGYRGFMN